MKLIAWQIYWPNVWKLWPSWYFYDDMIGGVPLRYLTVCFGPLQTEWIE